MPEKGAVEQIEYPFRSCHRYDFANPLRWPYTISLSSFRPTPVFLSLSLLLPLFLPRFATHIDDKDQKKSQKVLAELENIDDECDQNDIAFVKIDDEKEADEWGIDDIPTIVSVCAMAMPCRVTFDEERIQ